MPRLTLEGKIMEYEILRSSRASSLKISLDSATGVKVTVPAKLKVREIEPLLRQRAGWIFAKMSALSRLAGCPLPRRFAGGDMFFYLGQRYALKINEGLAPGVDVRGGELIVTCPAGGAGPEFIRAALVEWYQAQARELVGERVNLLAGRLGLRPARVRIKEQKTLWGSCSGQGSLNFNWKLVMAPPEAVDYVVIHELCHLKRMDHSPDFWRLVADYCPDFQVHRSWLRKYGPALSF